MSARDLILQPSTKPGLYRCLSSLPSREIERYVKAFGWRFFYLDGRRARDKAGFFQTIANAMAFPGYFGYNWDAFEECINDLAWAPAPGYVLLYDHAWWFLCAYTAHWRSAQSILEDTCTQWADRQTPFIVLLRHTHGCSGVAEVLRPTYPCHSRTISR